MNISNCGKKRNKIISFRPLENIFLNLSCHDIIIGPYCCRILRKNKVLIFHSQNALSFIRKTYLKIYFLTNFHLQLLFSFYTCS